MLKAILYKTVKRKVRERKCFISYANLIIFCILCKYICLLKHIYILFFLDRNNFHVCNSKFLKIFKYFNDFETFDHLLYFKNIEEDYDTQKIFYDLTLKVLNYFIATLRKPYSKISTFPTKKYKILFILGFLGVCY